MKNGHGSTTYLMFVFYLQPKFFRKLLALNALAKLLKTLFILCMFHYHHGSCSQELNPRSLHILFNH